MERGSSRYIRNSKFEKTAHLIVSRCLWTHCLDSWRVLDRMEPVGYSRKERAVPTRRDCGKWVEYDICKSGQARANWQIYAQFMPCVSQEVFNVFFEITTAVWHKESRNAAPREQEETSRRRDAMELRNNVEYARGSARGSCRV